MTKSPTYLFNLESLRFNSKFNQSIDPLRYLTNLQNLRFGTKFNQPIDSLSNLINLKHLSINSESFNHPINALANLTKLESLYINSTRYTQSLKTLTKLISLKELRIYNLDCKPDCIVNLTKLTNLKLSFYNIILDLDYFFENISKLTNLTELDLNRFSSKYSIKPVYYKNLKKLKLDIYDPITLSKLYNIEQLTLCYDKTIDLYSIVHNYKTLIDLNLNGFDCDNTNYNFLEELINLEYLEMNMMRIDSIDFLSKLKNLKGLILNTLINNFSIEILNHLDKLICLSIFSNENINLTNINLKNLKYLFTTNFDYFDLQNYTILSLGNQYFIYNSEELISYSRFMERILLEESCKYNTDNIVRLIEQIKNRQYIYN